MTEKKILDLAGLRSVVAAHRALNQKIVLANGCFDVLHVGHIRYLQGAKVLGDVLVVGVNSDTSMRGIKDAGRPLMPEAARARLVAALECVDYVTVFDDATVEPLIKALHPDVHAKGTDYAPETVPERGVVRSYGGEVAIVGDPKDHSTHDLIRRVLERDGERN
ncbi:MAG: adenylyltransferase/cytidyltransferase family protein [Acidobacteriia bacterium]|nr:adenylyltransferase/cytidyltransferase family protein [Terriglobia bacterium]